MLTLLQAAAGTLSTLPSLKELLPAALILVLALVGTVGILKLIKKIFPKSGSIAEKGKQWADKHRGI